MKSKGILIYLVLTFLPAWLIWGAAILIFNDPANPFFKFAIVPGGFTPAAAAFVVRKWVTKEGFGDAGLHLKLRKWPLYLVAFFWPLIVIGFIVIMNVFLQISTADYTLQRGFSSMLPPGVPVPEFETSAFVMLLLITTVFYTPVLFGEEFGWRSYLQIRIFKNRPIAAAITTGLIWAVWHYPLVLVGYQFPDYPLLGIPVFTVSAVLISIYLGWIRNRSGSVWATSLAHSSLNNLGATLAMVLFLGAENYIFVFFSGILGWIPMALLSFWIMGTGRLQSKEKLPASSKTNPAAAS